MKIPGQKKWGVFSVEIFPTTIVTVWFRSINLNNHKK